MSTCRNVRFIASAGTGKTHQVVSLYQALIFGRPYPADDNSLPDIEAGSIFDGHTRIPPERILMLTFTKNAAAEMRSRVTEAIEQELALGNADTEAFCWSLLRRLSGATISTIHSFAQQVLASHTLYLGLSPNLTILEESDAEDLRTDIIEATLKSALTGPDAAYADDLECVCDGRGVGAIEEAITRTLRLTAAWGLDLETNTPESLVATPTPPTLATLEAIQKKVEAAAWQKSKKLHEVLDALRESIRRLGRQNQNTTLISEAAAEIRLLSKGNWGQNEDVKALKSEVESALEAVAAYPDHVRARRLLISFLNLTRDCAIHIQARKRAQGVLDFDDLLFKARDLIQNRPDSVPGLDVIIVDEAQDNSRLQNELIRLVQAASQAAMVMCGDTKQTIYGWRGADADGLARFAETMHLTAVPLRTSYRSQKGVLDWVNDIFAGVVLGVNRYGDNETLAPCPKAQDLKGPSVELMIPDWEWGPKPNDSISTGKKEPKLRLTLTPKDVRTLAAENPTDEQWMEAAAQTEQAIALEARTVARRIRLLTTPGAGATWHPARVWDSSKSEWIKAPAKPYRFRDILILLRASTRQEIYEQALQEESIPFTTDGKGRGFFARQETLDVANLLSWLAFPRDRLAWLGVLRSPFVALSDNAVAVISSREERTPRPPTLPIPEDAPALGVGGPPASASDEDLKFPHATDAETWHRAQPILAQLRARAGRISAVELVREAIRLTGYDAILAGTFHGVQRLANLQKLLSWIQMRERDENLNLQETARRLSNEIASGREAPDAAVLDPDDDSVRINTVHAAKGLSSPVIILPDLRRIPQSDRDWILVTRNDQGEACGLAGKVKQFPDDEAREIESSLFSEASEQNKESRDQESRRLFYVACTRARDLVVLSGENPANGSKDSWRSWINQHLVQCNFNSSLVRLRPYSEVEKAWRKVAIPASVETLPSPAAFMTVASSNLLPAQRERYRLPVTVLSHLIAESPSPHPSPLKGEGVRSSCLALAPVNIAPSSHEDQEVSEPLLDRSQRGTLAHRILETLDYDCSMPLISQIEHSSEWGDANATERKQIRSQIESAADALSKLMTGVPAANIIRECPFASRFHHNGVDLIVDGKVDLIFLKDGVWHVVDYKFSDKGAEQLRSQYALQLAVYRDALFTPAKDPPLRLPRFETAAGQPAPLKMLLLGITSRGQCVEVDVTGDYPDSVAPRLISAARELASTRPLTEGGRV